MIRLLCMLAASSAFAQPPSREAAIDAMRRAARFYSENAAIHGGYHFIYAEDLSYARSEHGEGLTQIETQREGTPIAALAFLEAWEATRQVMYLNAAKSAARALIQGQLCSGGWDYVVEFDPEKRKKYPYRTDRNCKVEGPPTTLDDNVTQASIRVLMRVDQALQFRDPPIHEAALFALDGLMRAQYPNGAWPQRYRTFPDPARYPVRKASYPATWPREWPGTSYQDFYTFNDNTIADCIDTMLEAARIYKDKRYLQSAVRGGGFILLAQMPEPQPGWAQQYDLDMHPAWARVFEPPSVTGGETQGILRLLMVLFRETGDRNYLEPVPRALSWLKRSFLTPPAIRPEAWKRIPEGEPALARFFELSTNRPLFITKGTQISTRGLGSVRPDGYKLSYSDKSVITHYAVLISGKQVAAIEAEYDAVRHQPRPVILRGLSPWQGESIPSMTSSELASIISGMDDRGAWVEEGVVGKADRVVSVFAARPMVLTINGRPQQIHENDTIEVFDGERPPRQRVIRTTTFARNLRALAAYASTLKR